MTILLKNAKIYDGTAAPPFQGDLLLKDDRIARVAPSLCGGVAPKPKMRMVLSLSSRPCRYARISALSFFQSCA